MIRKAIRSWLSTDHTAWPSGHVGRVRYAARIEWHACLWPGIWPLKWSVFASPSSFDVEIKLGAAHVYAGTLGRWS